MKVVEISTVSNTFFAALKDKNKVRVAGIIKSIDDKETSSGQAKRFKGDIAVEFGDTVYQARYGFFPTAIRDALINGAVKLGKWKSFEFVLEGTKSVPETGGSSWSVQFTLVPRVEKARVLSLLED